jgi:hypothetical protein
MTTYVTETQTCGVCGAAVECTVLGSTNAFGSPDLDLRPPPMQRSTMPQWLQECPTCGYVNGDLSQTIDGARQTIESAPYIELMAQSKVPELARRFGRFALLQQADPASAGFALLRAAWACDDEQQSEQARSFRNQAADLLLTLQPFSDDEEQATIGTVLVDVLRRAERFSEAIELATALQTFAAVQQAPVILAVLQFQCGLCQNHDIACHTVDECEQSD